MIDLHAHPLPGLDDGPRDVEQALALARAAAAQGTRTMAATPHIDLRWRVDPSRVPVAVEALNAQLDAAGVDLEIVQGGEIASERLPGLSPADRDAVRLGGGPYLLIECPHAATGQSFAMTVFALIAKGERVLLAHPERSPVFHADTESLERLVQAGALSSITAGSLTGRFGETVRRFTLRLVSDGLVHAVTSDAHDDVRRPPALASALESADRSLPGLADQASWYVHDAPAAILAGDPIPVRPEPPALRRRRFSLRR